MYDAITGGPRAQGTQHFALVDPSGALNGPFNAFLLSPEIGEALQQLGATLRFGSSLTDELRELAILIVAGRWDCAFEQLAHEPIARAAGLSEGEIAAARTGNLDAFSDVNLILAQAVLGLLDGDLDDEAWTVAVAAFTRKGVFELTTLVGYYSTLALQLRTFRVE